MAYQFKSNTHQYFRPKVQEWAAHVDNPVAMSLTRSGTIAIYDSAVHQPPRSPVTPVAVVYRDFLREDERDRLRSASLHGYELELRRQAEQAAVWRSVKLSQETAMDWLMRGSYPGAKEKPDLFLEMDRSSHLLPPFPDSPYTSKPTLHICLSAPPDGVLIHPTDKGTIPTIFLHPGDAILLHPDARMRLCEGHEVETAFLRFYSDVNHPAALMAAEPQAAPPIAVPSVEDEHEKEGREVRAKVDTRRAAMFAGRKQGSAARAKQISNKKQSAKASLAAVEKEERMTKEEKRLWDEVVAEEKAAWDAEQKRLETEEQEAAEMEKVYRRKKEAVEAMKRELEIGTLDAGPGASVQALRPSASASTAAAGLRQKVKEPAESEVEEESLQGSMKSGGRIKLPAGRKRNYAEGEKAIMLEAWDGIRPLTKSLLRNCAANILEAGHGVRLPEDLKWYMKNTLWPRYAETYGRPKKWDRSAWRTASDDSESDAGQSLDLTSSQIPVKAEPDVEDIPNRDDLPLFRSSPVAESAKPTRKRKASSIAIPTPAPAEEMAKSTRRGRAY